MVLKSDFQSINYLDINVYFTMSYNPVKITTVHCPGMAW